MYQLKVLLVCLLSALACVPVFSFDTENPDIYREWQAYSVSKNATCGCCTKDSSPNPAEKPDIKTKPPIKTTVWAELKKAEELLGESEKRLSSSQQNKDPLTISSGEQPDEKVRRTIKYVGATMFLGLSLYYIACYWSKK